MMQAFGARAASAAALTTVVFAAGCDLFAPRGMSPAETSAALRRYCAECHNSVDLAGDIDFARLDPAHVEADAATWETVVRKLRTHTMPPRDARRRPDAATYERFATGL